jgi:NADH-quinone oxidoreductase subunit K
MMLQGVSVSLVAWSRYHDDWGGQMLVIFILTVAACEAAIALAVVLTLFHKSGKLDIVVWQQLREDDQPPYLERRLAATAEAEPEWPKLVPAGIEPEPNLEELSHRPRV